MKTCLRVAMLSLIFAFGLCRAFCMEIETSGLIPGEKDGKLVVKGVFPGTPAERGGLRLGQEITEVMHRGKMTPVTMNNLATFFSGLNNPKNRTQVFKTSTGRTYTLSSTRITLSVSNLPRSTVQKGSIRSIDKFTVHASYRASDGVCKGDGFLVLKGGAILGTATLHEPGNVNTQVDVKINKRKRSMEDIAKLNGAALVFYKASFHTCRKSVDKYQSLKSAVRKQEKKYLRGINRKNCQAFPKVTVMQVDKRYNYFSFQGRYGPKMVKLGTGQVVSGALITYHIGCDRNTKILSYQDPDKGGHISFSDIKPNDIVDVYCDLESRKCDNEDKPILVFKDDGKRIVKYKAKLVVIK